VLNAANEVAVHAFLTGRLPFLGIPAVIEAVLDDLGTGRVHSFDTLYAADADARALAADAVEREGARA
jgi:1-deoxy-D-xylulose-5-phosphate reductoisomerase